MNWLTPSWAMSFIISSFIIWSTLFFWALGRLQKQKEKTYRARGQRNFIMNEIRNRLELWANWNGSMKEIKRQCANLKDELVKHRETFSQTDYPE